MPKIGKCSSCSQEIVWCHSAATNYLMPLQTPPPGVTGNVIMVDGKAHVMHGDLFDEQLEGERWVNHFAYCPNAAKHRKKK